MSTSFSRYQPGDPVWGDEPLVARVARAGGLVFFMLAALVALGVVPMYQAMAIAAWGPAVQLVLWGGAGALTLGAYLAARRWKFERLGQAVCVWNGFVVLVLCRILASWCLDGPLVSDFGEYHMLAERVAHGGPWFSDLRPMGYPLMLAFFYVAFGPQHWVGEALNLGLALLTGVLLYDWTRREAGRAAGVVALWLYALLPAHVLMVAVQGTEIPYAAVFMGALWTLARLRPLGGGMLLGLSQYVRPTSLLLLPALVVWYWRRKRALALAIAAMLVVLSPVAEWNWRSHHKLSLSTSTFGAWTLLVGSNQRSNGFWNAEDTAWIATVPRDQREAAMKQRAWERIAGDPLGFAGLAVRKFGYMWGAEDYGAYWTMDVGKPAGGDRRAVTAGYLLSQCWYALVLLLALVACLGPLPPGFGAGLIGLGTLVGAHTFVEVQSRYHFYWTPFFCALAGIGARRVWERFSPR